MCAVEKAQRLCAALSYPWRRDYEESSCASVNRTGTGLLFPHTSPKRVPAHTLLFVWALLWALDRVSQTEVRVVLLVVLFWVFTFHYCKHRI